MKNTAAKGIVDVLSHLLEDVGDNERHVDDVDAVIMLGVEALHLELLAGPVLAEGD